VRVGPLVFLWLFTRAGLVASARADLAIRQGVFEALSHFHAHATIAGGPEKEEAVVAVLLADAPHREQLDRGLLDRESIQRANDDDGDFAAGVALERRGALIELRNGLRFEGAGGIGHPGAVLNSRIGDARERFGAGCRSREQEHEAARRE
jgi:hypothetical protein